MLLFTVSIPHNPIGSHLKPAAKPEARNEVGEREDAKHGDNVPVVISANA